MSEPLHLYRGTVMSGGSMRLLFRVGHRPHPLDRKRYGAPRLALYWAKRGVFTHPGLYVWTGRRNVRVLPG